MFRLIVLNMFGQTEKRYPKEINKKYSLFKYSITFDKLLYGIVNI